MRNWFKTTSISLDERARSAFAYISQPLTCFFGATTEQLDDVYKAYTNLWASTPTEGQARAIFDSLVAIALRDRKRRTINWLLREIYFEAFAAATGDREWAALMDLEQGAYVKKEVQFALYQERVAREL